VAVQSFEIHTKNGAGPVFQVDAQVNDSFSDIVARINAATSGGDSFTDYGYAQLISDPTTGRQTIIVKPKETGVENQMSMNNVSVPPDVLEKIGFTVGGVLNELQTAKDATVVIDEVTVHSSTNLLDGAIPGVQLNLHKADMGNEVTITVGMSDDDIVQNVSDFVDKFNEITDMLDKYIDEDPLEDPKTEDEMKVGILSGDTDLAMAKSQIRMKTTGYVDSVNADYVILSQIGIQSEGSFGSTVSNNIEFDEQTFRTALQDNQQEVTGMLERWADQLQQYLEQQTKVSVIQSDAGNFYRRMLSIDDQIDRIDEDIDNWDDRLLDIEEQMRYKFSAMEEALQKLQSQSSYLTSQLNSLMNANNNNQ